MVAAYFYSNTAIQTTLSGSVSSGALSIGVVATTGFPTSYPYVLALDYGAATEELVTVTAAGGTTLTLGARGHSGTSAQSHSLGAVVRHVFHAGDASDFRTHEAATSDVHGVTGALVGATMSQTLTNKTLTSPTINSATFASGGSFAGTYTGTPTFSGAVVLSGTPSISTGAALAGTFTGTPTFSGNVTHSGEIILTNLLRGSRATATDSMYEGRVTADTNARWFIQADGKQRWGPGNAVQDTNLYRFTTGKLATDSDFAAFGTFSSEPVSTSEDAFYANLPSGSTASSLLLQTNGVTKVSADASGNLITNNLPVLMAKGQASFVFAAAAQVDVAVSFGVTFASVPKVACTLSGLPAGSSALILRTSAVTTTGMTLRANDVGGVVRTLTIAGDWVAVG